MKTKWYLGILLVVLALCGIVQNRTSLPNQEVLIRFHEQQVTVNQTQEAIAFIKSELHSLGIDDLKVEEGEKHQLKISYFSNLDVVAIQSVLSKAPNFQITPLIDQNSTSQRNTEKVFDVAVYEIQKSTKPETGSAGKAAIITKQDYDRSSNLHLQLYLNSVTPAVDFVAVYQNKTICNHKVITATHKSYAIPEVRAGPDTNIQLV